MAPTSYDGEGHSRRELLCGIASAGVGAISGCSRLQARADTTADIDVDGPFWQTTFVGSLWNANLGQPTGLLERFAFDEGFVRDPVTRELTHILTTDRTESKDEVKITLRSDLRWSNGEPLTAADVGRWLYMLRMGTSWFARVPRIRKGEEQPTSALEAITDIEWSEETLTVTGEFATIGRPLQAINSALGRYPATYYDALWEAFQDAFDDVPWENETTWQHVTDLIESNIWQVSDDLLPEAGILLEDEYHGSGVEAAFSGLWYPYRVDTQSANLYFKPNEAHPFADRIDFDTVVWTFRQAPGRIRADLLSSRIDGKMMTEVTERLIDRVPTDYETIEGGADRIWSVMPNHQADYFRNRDVRAALLYAIDRERVADSLNLVTAEPVSVPGADLQSPKWVPPKLRRSLFDYDHDPDAAARLLKRAGFHRDGGTWQTPSGEPFSFKLVTTSGYKSVDNAVATDLRAFGVDVTSFSIGRTSYQARVQNGTFYSAMNVLTSPNAAGRRENRASGYVEPIVHGNGFLPSAYLKREVTDAVERSDDLHWMSGEEGVSPRFAFDSLDALRAITVKAPPLGEPAGDLKEWPYLYHAVRVESALDDATRLRHARICTWIYNYQVPELELVTRGRRIFHQTPEWTIPDPDDTIWQQVSDRLQPGGLWAALGWGHIDIAESS